MWFVHNQQKGGRQVVAAERRKEGERAVKQQSSARVSRRVAA